MIALAACHATAEPKTPTPTTNNGTVQVGTASWYGKELAGHKTASGERFDPQKLTAAHRTLRFGTQVRVTRVKTGKSVTVRINDRGPFSKTRIIDLSEAAARTLGMIDAGVTKVELEVVHE
ncbi:septal ring lytic transglycosylase RlpA family protein [soil metagenome]